MRVHWTRTGFFLHFWAVFVKQLKLRCANFGCMCFVSCWGTFRMVVVCVVAVCYAILDQPVFCGAAKYTRSMSEVFHNPHNTDWHREIAEQNTILLTQVGSGLHGVTIEGTDDRDEMGVCIEPPECVVGLRKFEQYQWRTQPEGARSGAGDIDLVVYSLRKWARLAAQGNPTVLLLLFAPEHEIVKVNYLGHELQQRADLFLSRDAGNRFIGYLDAQRDRMLGLRSQRTNRPELVDVYGFDTKFAYHAVRLGLQGVELLKTGGITLPIPEPERSWLRGLRVGEVTKDTVMDRIADLRAQLVTLTETADLPERPDYDKLNDWLITTYNVWWNRNWPTGSDSWQAWRRRNEKD